MQHGRCARRCYVTEWGPAMERPKRNEYPEAKEQNGKDKVLRIYRERIGPNTFGDGHDIKRAWLHIDIESDQADECDERAGREIKSDLKGGVVFVLSPAPYADHDECRDQRE